MIDGLFLADKSALEQVRHSEQARSTATELLREGSLASGEAVALEVLYSSRNRAEYESTRSRLLGQPWLVLDDRVSDRAMEVQRLLAERGMHRMSVMDLLIAATAEVHGATVLHHDHDFDRIAAVTGQATRWIVPPGSGFGGDR